MPSLIKIGPRERTPKILSWMNWDWNFLFFKSWNVLPSLFFLPPKRLKYRGSKNVRLREKEREEEEEAPYKICSQKGFFLTVKGLLDKDSATSAYSTRTVHCTVRTRKCTCYITRAHLSLKLVMGKWKRFGECLVRKHLDREMLPIGSRLCLSVRDSQFWKKRGGKRQQQSLPVWGNWGKGGIGGGEEFFPLFPDQKKSINFGREEIKEVGKRPSGWHARGLLCSVCGTAQSWKWAKKERKEPQNNLP